MDRPRSSVLMLMLLAAASGVLLPGMLSVYRLAGLQESKFRFSESMYQLGSALQNDSLEAKVLLINQTQSRLRVSRFLASCRCTIVDDEMLGKSIAAGEQIIVPLRIDTGLLPVVSSSIVISATDEYGNDYHAH